MRGFKRTSPPSHSATRLTRTPITFPPCLLQTNNAVLRHFTWSSIFMKGNGGKISRTPNLQPNSPSDFRLYGSQSAHTHMVNVQLIRLLKPQGGNAFEFNGDSFRAISCVSSSFWLVDQETGTHKNTHTNTNTCKLNVFTPLHVFTCLCVSVRV